MANVWSVGQRYDSLVSNVVVASSIDGVTWSNVSISSYPFSNRQQPTSILWKNSNLIVASNGGQVAISNVSDQYKNWTSGSCGVDDFGITSLTSISNSIFACGTHHYSKPADGFQDNTEVAQIFTSPFGNPQTFYMVYTSGIDPSNLYSIKYIDTLVSPILIAVGSQNFIPFIVYSQDNGASWNEIQVGNLNVSAFYDVEYYNSKWYFGCDGFIAITENFASGPWTTTEIFGSYLSTVNKISINPQGQIVAVTPSKLWFSDNFETWNNFVAEGYNWRSIQWFENKWIAGTDSLLTQYNLWTSTDTLTWTPLLTTCKSIDFTAEN